MPRTEELGVNQLRGFLNGKGYIVSDIDIVDEDAAVLVLHRYGGFGEYEVSLYPTSRDDMEPIQSEEEFLINLAAVLDEVDWQITEANLV